MIRFNQQPHSLAAIAGYRRTVDNRLGKASGRGQMSSYADLILMVIKCLMIKVAHAVIPCTSQALLPRWRASKRWGWGVGVHAICGTWAVESKMERLLIRMCCEYDGCSAVIWGLYRDCCTVLCRREITTSCVRR